MYSNSPQNSWKYCECDNNNLYTVTIMNNKNSKMDGKKPKKDKNYNEYNDNDTSIIKKQMKTLGEWNYCTMRCNYTGNSGDLCMFLLIYFVYQFTS